MAQHAAHALRLASLATTVVAGALLAGCPVSPGFEGVFYPDSNVTWQDVKTSEIKGVFENGITTITVSEKASDSATASAAATASDSATASATAAGLRSLRLTLTGRLERGKTYDLLGPICATCSTPAAQLAFLEEPGKEWVASGSMAVDSAGWTMVELVLKRVQMLPVPGSKAQGSFRMDMKIRLPMP